jgi:hypothetical protein
VHILALHLICDLVDEWAMARREAAAVPVTWDVGEIRVSQGMRQGGNR